jgi:DMSO/TMAO reductase YedYZ heme-binding membrane subunit
MDKAAETLSNFFGSLPFILVHIAWFALWFPLGGSKDSLTLIVSLEAIFLSLFILRAETVQAARMEKQNKQIIKEVK